MYMGCTGQGTGAGCNSPGLVRAGKRRQRVDFFPFFFLLLLLFWLFESVGLVP